MRSKARYKTSNFSVQTGQAGEHDVVAPAHTMIRPSKETRALVLRAQRAMLEAARKEQAAARRTNKEAARHGRTLGALPPVVLRPPSLEIESKRATQRKRARCYCGERHMRVRG